MLTVEPSPIPGLLVVRIPVHADARGWFKENWQREKMTALGVPDFEPVQNNVSFNTSRGTTRGIHTEPWDKLVSVAAGRVFGAWVDMREGPSFGATFTHEIDPGVAVFVPRGVGNSYQALDDGTAYCYLVNEHWRPGAAYAALHLADPTAAIAWPISLAEAEISAKDLANPMLDEVTPVAPRRTLIVGAKGQLGRALTAVFPEAHPVDLPELDITDPATVADWNWSDYDLVLNAAAYTDVDAAEGNGRAAAWATNASAPALLTRIARAHRLTLVHYSTDYVFDGSTPEHGEDEPLTPLSVYGQSKAAGDLAVSVAPRHYLIRTSWVIGEGNNFVRTMQRLAADGVSPRVVSDQIGRLTFTGELARATSHLLASGAPFGTYNVTNSGPVTSWADIARHVFARSGRSPDDITDVTTSEYAEGRATAPRPLNSVLSLKKLEATGFVPEDAENALASYVAAGSAG